MSIQVKGVTKKYSKQIALDNVGFEINPGEIVGFIGPNGAGKSTMMKIITGYLSSDAGEVKVNGFDVLEDSLKVRQNIGYLPEHNPLYPEMYVKEYLKFVAGIHKLERNSKKHIKDIIELTGLGAEQRKLIGALSKGYRQRVGLAQALIHDPKVLILDEPTSGLDPNQIIEIRNVISTVGKNKTVMLSTHIMQEVEAICDRVIIINKGIIVANDLAKNIQSHVTDELHTILVEFDMEPDIIKLEKIEGVNKIKKLKKANWLIQCNTDVRSDIFSFAVSNNLKVLSMQKKEKSLEEVFKELTK